MTTTQQQEPAPTSQAEPSQKKRPNPNASRSSGERGLGGEGLLSEKPPLPPESPHPTSLEEGARGRGLFYQKSPLPRILRSTLGSFEIYIVALVVLGELRYNEGV